MMIRQFASCALMLSAFAVSFTVPFALAQTEVLSEAPSETQASIPADLNKAFLDPDLKAEEWAQRFEVESREIFASRKEIVAALKLQAGSRIADVGSGTGLFVQPFSTAATNTGRVFALDISPRLIEHIKQRVEKEGLRNVDVVLSKEDSIGLPHDSVDMVFLCDTYHHFEYHEKMLRSIRQALRRGGELVVIDFHRIEGVSREWALEHVRAGEERVRAEIEKAHFQFIEEVEIPGLKENYFLRFKKP